MKKKQKPKDFDTTTAIQPKILPSRTGTWRIPIVGSTPLKPVVEPHIRTWLSPARARARNYVIFFWTKIEFIISPSYDTNRPLRPSVIYDISNILFLWLFAQLLLRNIDNTRCILVCFCSVVNSPCAMYCTFSNQKMNHVDNMSARKQCGNGIMTGLCLQI